ncbi:MULTISPECIES: hypothetical protein [Flavobacterium]|uniref:DUF998 domain-containing protein n=1 Tax=Flavobacterium jumunjinense TaxID=998845 RepID=A0ABV5GRT1_9FLAO|nr:MULTISPECIES: hypothetical protein [Flavobacterium]
MITTAIKEKCDSLKKNKEEQKELLIKNSYTLRMLIGVLGILLPLILPLLLLFTDKFKEVLPSISHYYYTKSGPLFIAIMSLLAVFFIIYKEKCADFIISSIAGIAALLVVLLPTDSLENGCLNPYKNHVVTILEKNETRENLHYIAAGIFLLALAYMSIFRFTIINQGYENAKKQLQLRHRLYRTLGIIMVFCLLIIFFGSDHFNKMYNNSFHKFHDDHNLTFWFESVAVECFGIAWLVKGREYKFKK